MGGVIGKIVGETTAKKAARKTAATEEQTDRAVDALGVIVGSEGAEMAAHELLSPHDAGDAIEGLIDWLEGIASTCETLVIEEDILDEEGNPVLDADGKPTFNTHTFHLTRVLKMNGQQIADVWGVLKSIDARTDGSSGGIMQIVNILLASGRSAELFATMYLPDSERKYRSATRDARVRFMEDLTAEQMIGCLWRFFTGSGLSSAGGIRTYLRGLLAAAGGMVSFRGRPLVGASGGAVAS